MLHRSVARPARRSSIASSASASSRPLDASCSICTSHCAASNLARGCPSVVESRWRLLPGCGISRVLKREERPPMKKPYRIVSGASTPDRRELADWLAKDGQL